MITRKKTLPQARYLLLFPSIIRNSGTRTLGDCSIGLTRRWHDGGRKSACNSPPKGGWAGQGGRKFSGNLELTIKKRRLLLRGRLLEISNLNALHMAEMVESELVILTVTIHILLKVNTIPPHWTGMELNKRAKSGIICIRADEKGYHNGKGKIQRRNETPDRQVCT